MPSTKQIALESWRRFGEFVPELQRPRRAALVFGGTTVACAGGLVAGTKIAAALPYGALWVQSFFVLWAGAWMYGGFWMHRAAYRARYGAAAYRYLFFRFILPAVGGAGAALNFPVLIGGPPLLPPASAYVTAGYLLLAATLIEIRGKELFWNIDLRAFVYSVFPERGAMLTSGIFQWLRHPVYSTAVRFAVGVALLRNNLHAVLCAAFIAAALWLWAGIEERELERVDPRYADYRRRVPAFFVLPPVGFWRYLLTGKSF